MFVYPNSDLDRPDKLSSLLGRFWESTYPGSDLVSQLLYARGRLVEQSFTRLNEVADSLSQSTISVFRTKRWSLYRPLLSQLNGPLVALPQYGQGDIYQPAGGVQYGVPVSAGEFALPLPANLHDVRLICNRITQPSVVLVRDLDFRIDLRRGAIYFNQNPFDNPLFGRRSQVAGGDVTDETLQLWLFRGQFDFDDLYNQHGYVIGLKAASSEGYKQLLNTTLAALIQGGALRHVQEAFAAVTGIPLAGGTETVELLTRDAQWQYVITNKAVYPFRLTATPIVSVGQTVQAGDPLVSALQFFEFQNGQVPNDLAALAVGRGFLLEGFYSDLGFRNIDVPLQVTTDRGYTRVEFKIGGFPIDVEDFWNRLHDNGIAKGQTLAMLLDKRPNPVGQPTAASLPATINPLKFLISNVLRNNVALVRLVNSDANPGTLSLGLIARVLRKIVPPHTAVLVLVELSGSEKPVILAQPPSPTEPGYVESGELFLAPDPVTETVDPSLVTESGRIWQASGYCR